jgi:hypothetical protein
MAVTRISVIVHRYSVEAALLLVRLRLLRGLVKIKIREELGKDREAIPPPLL